MNDTTASPKTHQVTGVVREKHDDRIVLSIPETSYQLHLNVYKPVETPVGKKITGVIRAQVTRLDKSGTGGKYIEPVYGRPRRIQGTIKSIDPAERTVTINATVPIVCKTDVNQNPSQFNVGDFVTCGVLPGASFTVSV